MHREDEEFLADMGDWLRRRALFLCGSSTHQRFDDAVQEGRITLWRTYRETGIPAQAMAHASTRMKAVALNVGVRMTGEEPRERFTAPQDNASVEALMDAGVEEVLFAADRLAGLELAYHYGEIRAAFDALTPKQQQYVYARFWCGIDMPAGSRNEGVKQAKEANPVLRRDNLWTGGNKDRKGNPMPGAKQRLAKALAHLAGVV